MKLHNDKDAFIQLLEVLKERTGIRADVLEKDYYVVLILEELANMQKDGLTAYFKGGTALYKALKTTNRFSEDIDLSVDTRGCSRTQNDKRLEKATKKYTSLERNRLEGKTNRSEIVSVYCYEPVTDCDMDDALQRFGKLKVEATSFTISEPVTSLEIAPLIYDFATSEEKAILEEKYEVGVFSVESMTMERIFVDKLFAAEAYVRKSADSHKAFEAAKHIYDLCVMIENDKIIKLIGDEDHMKKLLDIRIEEEKERRDGIPGVLPVNFEFFDSAEYNKEVRAAYEIMQKQYILQMEYRIAYEKAMDSLKRLKKSLANNTAWINC